jgi:hypothetical protein
VEIGGELQVAGGTTARRLPGRRRRARSPIVPACAVALGLVLVGQALPAPGAQRTIRFLEISRTPRAQLVDHNRNGRPDPGDSLAAISNLYRWDGARRGARAGMLLRVCILATSTTGNCTATVALPDGAIQIQGFVDFDHDPDELAVVGGTGAYAGMRGTFSARPMSGAPPRWSDTIRLLR